VKKPTISFEYFPPKTDKLAEALSKNVDELAALDPKYMTVTYGAGGATRDKTLETAIDMQKRTGVPIATHLTYINTPRKDIYALADHIWNSGIKHIIALRGDLPKDLNWPLDPDNDYFQYTSHFVAALKARQDFEISVGCYPEKHPDAPSLDKDIEALMKKIDAGADRAITQFFFDNSLYYNFLEEAAKFDIKAPIVPGILPVHDFAAMLRFAKTCQANVPDWMHEKFAGLEDKPEDAKKVATELLINQTEDLAANGVDHIHFYTLNKSDITKDACEALGYKRKAA
jgi:methylenetetrahydrofolate reductase (NADPH)